ncbi:unnamed protein product [Gadus morhua 'NCC']
MFPPENGQASPCKRSLLDIRRNKVSKQSQAAGVTLGPGEAQRCNARATADDQTLTRWICHSHSDSHCRHLETPAPLRWRGCPCNHVLRLQAL